MLQFFKKLWTDIISFTNWSSSDFGDFPQNEVGDLMRRYIARKSWFDTISSKWCELGFLSKFASATTAILFAGVIGVVAGAPIIISVTTALFICLTHFLFIAHEKNRRAGAKIFAEESIELSQILQESTDCFKSVTKELTHTSEELKALAADTKEHSTVIDIESKKVKEEGDSLARAVDLIQVETSHFVSQQKQVMLNFEKIAQNIDACDKSIALSSDVVNGIGQTADGFSTAVRDMDHAKNKFSHAVDAFCLFANEQERTKSPPLKDVVADDFINILLKQNEEDDLLIASLGLS